MKGSLYIFNHGWSQIYLVVPVKLCFKMPSFGQLYIQSQYF